jgi:hypothetical protein
MSVTRENEGNVQAGGFGQATRVVREQDQCSGSTAGNRGDVAGAASPEPNTREFERLFPDCQSRPCITEDRDAVAAQRGRHVVVVIMIAQDGKNAVWRRESAERVRGRVYEASITPGHVITAEDDQVGPSTHQQLDGSGHIVFRNPSASMDVGEKADAQA